MRQNVVIPLSVIAARCHPPQGAFSCPTGNSPCLPKERLEGQQNAKDSN